MVAARAAIAMVLGGLLAACSHHHDPAPAADAPPSQDGVYDVTRTVTAGDLTAPDFQIADTYTITIANGMIQSSIDSGAATDIVRTDDELMFNSQETWTSSQGSGAVTLAYDLQVPADGTMTGSVDASVVCASPAATYYFTLSICGTKRP
jgi:hypothetical protein